MPAKLKPPQARLGERPEGPGELLQLLGREPPACARSVNDKNNLRLEEMAAELPGCRLQVLLTVMQTAAGCLQGRADRMGGLSRDDAEHPCEEPRPAPSDMLGEKLGKSVMAAEEVSIEQTKR